MTITGIKPYEKGKNRVAVYLNDEFAFVLYRGELSKYRLKENMELDEELYNRILDETLYKRARLRGMNLLQKMDRTEADLRNKLSEGGYPLIVIDDAIEYLKSFHYIDDARYASEFIRFKINSLSRKDIINKLRSKGVNDTVIKEQLSEYEDNSGDNGSKEEEVARKLMLKKCSNLSNLDNAQRMKLFSYLYRKGFSMDTIEKAYKDLT